jgi:hypothetical protein
VGHEFGDCIQRQSFGICLFIHITIACSFICMLG